MAKEVKKTEETNTTEKKNFIAQGVDEVKDHPVAAAIGAGVMGLLGLIGLGVRAIFGGGGDSDDDNDAGTPGTSDD